MGTKTLKEKDTTSSDNCEEKYNFYKRWRMFTTKKNLFTVARGTRKRYMLTFTQASCAKKFTASSTPGPRWEFKKINKLNIFFVDIFNYKDRIWMRLN